MALDRPLPNEFHTGSVLRTVGFLAVMGLLPDNARVTGSVRFKGSELLALSDSQLSAKIIKIT